MMKGHPEGQQDTGNRQDDTGNDDDAVPDNTRNNKDYVLDDMSNNHSPSAHPKRANTGKNTSHQSWADAVRPKPSKGSIGGLSPITKR
jgi:hypothetical protein